jgi:hypothetical protein
MVGNQVSQSARGEHRLRVVGQKWRNWNVFIDLELNVPTAFWHDVPLFALPKRQR